jgi:hypothetical protein
MEIIKITKDVGARLINAQFFKTKTLNKMKISKTLLLTEVENTYENVLEFLDLPDMYEVDYQKNINSIIIKHNSNDLTICIDKIEEITISKVPTLRTKGVTITFFSSFMLTQIL